MRVVRRVIAVLAMLLLVVVIAGVGALVWVTGRALPKTSGTLQVPGLQGQATVQRDVHGIAQITATTSHDLFLAQGYTHAQERMWQMEVWRHISSGRLSELFGASTVDTDRFIRTVGWRRAAERDLAALPADVRAVLDAYAEGVNAWLGANRGRLGLAFLATGADPEPWTALDTLAWGKVQAWNLGGNLDGELFRYLADARLGDPAKTDELFLPHEFGPVITPSGLPGSGGAGAMVRPPEGTIADPPAAAMAVATHEPALDAVQAEAWQAVAALADDALRRAGLDAATGLGSDHGIGSNDWVVGPAMSTTHGALLANDPHLGISMPSIWYVNGLHCAVVDEACPFDVAGVSFPGVPGVILGHNARIAWGVTNVDPDVQDLVIETVDPADATHYLGPDGVSRPFETRTEEIKVAGAAPIELEVRVSAHGPILNGVDHRLDGAPLMALRWTAVDPAAAPDRTVEAFMRLDLAGDFQGFRDALSLLLAPSQNFVYADVDGHIGYQLPGYIPIRSDPADHGDRPVSGSDGAGEWTGRIPYEDLPWQLDPEPGWIVSANNAPVDDAYPGFIGQEWDPGYRAERIIDLINDLGQDGLTTAEMGVIQNDTAPLRARDVVLLLSDAVPATEDGQTVAARIDEWSGACDIDNAGCAAYMAWEFRVLRGIFDDELGPLARDYVGSPYSWVALGRLLESPDAPWWDDTTTPEVETADQIVLRAMDQAGADLRGAYGSPERWSWGRMHTATFEEGTLGTSGIGPLEWYLNDGPVAVAGTAGAIDNTSSSFSGAYPDPDDPTAPLADYADLWSVTSLPSYRLTIDLSDLDGAGIVITTGQAGNPFDRHYNDLIDVWGKGELVPLPFMRAAIDAATVAQLTLTP